MADNNPFASLGLGMMGSDASYAKQAISDNGGFIGATLLNSLFGTDLPTTQKGLKEYKTGIANSAIGSITGVAPSGAAVPVKPVDQQQLATPVAPVPPVTPNPAYPLQQQSQTTTPSTGVFRKFLDLTPN